MNTPIALLVIVIAALLSGCKDESQKTVNNEWPSSWMPAPAHDTWPYEYAPYQEFKTESTHSEASVKNFLNIADNKINFKPYDASTHFLAIQVMIYNKKEAQAMKVCSLTHIMPSADEASAYLYIAVAPEDFDSGFQRSERWKLYIESKATYSGNQGAGPYRVRETIPSLAGEASSITFHFLRKNDIKDTPYLSFADTDDFEIRIYSHLVQNPPKN